MPGFPWHASLFLHSPKVQIHPRFKGALRRRNRYDQHGRADLDMNLIWGNYGFAVQRQTDLLTSMMEGETT